MRKIKVFIAFLGAFLIALVPLVAGRDGNVAERTLFVKEEAYIVKTVEDELCIYKMEGKREVPFMKAPINTAGLREGDKVSLKEGIRVETMTDALILFEDFLG